MTYDPTDRARILADEAARCRTRAANFPKAGPGCTARHMAADVLEELAQTEEGRWLIASAHCTASLDAWRERLDNLARAAWRRVLTIDERDQLLVGEDLAHQLTLATCRAGVLSLDPENADWPAGRNAGRAAVPHAIHRFGTRRRIWGAAWDLQVMAQPIGWDRVPTAS